MSAALPASTPGRATRARSKTPLPAVGAKQTHAYGAKGKTELRSQVRAGTDDFAAAFAGQRIRETRGASVARSASVRSGSEEPGLAQPVPNQPTAVDATAAYSGGTAANRHPEIERERSVPVLALSAPQALLFGLVTFLVALFSVLLLGLAPLPSLRLEAGRHNIVAGIKTLLRSKPYNVPPATLEDRWFRFQHDQLFLEQLPDYIVPNGQPSINVHLLSRLIALEDRVASLEGDLRLTNDTLSEIRQLLPTTIILRKIDGHYAIPDDFWAAIQQRMVEDNEMAPLWRAWLLRNEEELKQLQSEHLQTVFDAAVENKHLVTREAFLAAIQQNNDWLANEYSHELQKMWNHNMDNLKSLTENAANEIIDRSQISYYAKKQVDFLQKANALHNTYQALRGVNYFSAVGGAVVDPHITSPTVRKNYPAFIGGFMNFFSSSMLSRPPIEALFKWNEATECWCGSPTEKANGGVNIGVLTSHRVYPESLVIEHIPAVATLDIAAAPRVFEVWADVGSKETAKRFEHNMRESDHLLALPYLKPKPLERFVCIGTGEYHIHDSNHVQSFKLYGGVQDYSIATNRVVVRAATNWGANHTCFYRLRLTGTKA